MIDEPEQLVAIIDQTASRARQPVAAADPTA
jgi:hypothetical protein